MLTISEVADFVGVTVRAVRHYHQRGLLAEPSRDASGYRRYDADAVVELIRIKVLAEAGVPLARVAELLRADEAEFRTATEEIDRALREQVRRLHEHRRRVARLAAGESLALPAEVVDYLDLLRGLGISESTVAMERDGWVLVAARSPEQIVPWIEAKRALFAEPTFAAMYLAFDSARNWDPEDLRLLEVAETMLKGLAEVMGNVHPEVAEANRVNLDDGALVSLLDAQVIASSPAWLRLGELLQASGWPGWDVE